MSEATLFSQTIVPSEGNDTITIPQRFYGQPVIVVAFRKPSPPPPPESDPSPAATLPDIPESLRKKFPKFTKEQIEALGNSPRMKELREAWDGCGKSFPPNVTMRDIREMRLKEKYGI